MAVYKPLVLGKDETDINKIMNKLYRFSRDLKFTKMCIRDRQEMGD